MRVRIEDQEGDMTFGVGVDNYYVNDPAGVAQCVRTRLALTVGEWFLDMTDGTDWNVQVLGERTASTRDPVIIERAGGTQGVNEILNYSSTFNPGDRRFSAQMRLDTIYGKSDTVEVPS